MKVNLHTLKHLRVRLNPPNLRCDSAGCMEHKSQLLATMYPKKSSLTAKNIEPNPPSKSMNGSFRIPGIWS